MASTDSLDTVKKFAKKNNASFPILSDNDKKIAKSYGVLIAGRYLLRALHL